MSAKVNQPFPHFSYKMVYIHLLQTAVDLAGNVDPTPSTFTWGVDKTAPETILDSATVLVSGTSVNLVSGGRTSATGIEFGFSANDNGGSGIDHFVCKRLPFPTICTSPIVYSSLPDGTYTFEVYSVDKSHPYLSTQLGGNRDLTPATFTWTVDHTGPTVAINSAKVTRWSRNFH